MLARDMGVSFDPSNHAAYVESWLKVLREDKNEIFRAARDAEIIKTWVMEPERRRGLEKSAQDQRAALTATESRQGGEPTIEMPAEPSQPMRSNPAGARKGVMDVRLIDRLENYFLPGRLVPSYGGVEDKVVAFRRLPNEGWEVVVQDVPANGQLGPERTHCTQPREFEFKAWEKEHPVEAKPRIYLNVPFDEKNTVKMLGAAWDRDAKSWYVRPDYNVEPFAKWIQPAQEMAPAETIAQVLPDDKKARTFIAVPFAEKDQAKTLGARWDKNEKAWYIPEGQDHAPFAKWTAAKSAPDLTPEQEFAEALKANGLVLDRSPEMDGKWHRVPVIGDKGSDKNGAYRGYLDGRPSGLITNYKAGVQALKWVSMGTALTEEARAQIQAEAANVRAAREAAQREAAEKAAKVAYGIWTNLPGPATAQDCEYLAAKGVGGHGVKVNDEGKMIVPARDGAGRLWTLQFVGDGSKLFLKDSHKSGTMHVIEPTGKGTLDTLDSQRFGTIIIGEGYATCATIHEETGRAVVVAFDSGNLKAVAEAVRERYPDRPILIAADNDHANKLGNVGMIKADEAAKAVGGSFLSPNFTVDEKASGLIDFNDLARSRSPASVKRVFEVALAQGHEQQRSIA